MTLPNGEEWINELGMNNSELAVNWVNENLLNTEEDLDLRTMETVARPGGLVDLTRIKSQSYINNGWKITISRTYPSVMNCAGVVGEYELIQL